MNSTYSIRSMELSDIDQVGEIDRESFPTMWPPVAYKRELQQNRLARYIVAYEMGSEVQVGVNVRPVDRHDRESAVERIIRRVKKLLGQHEPDALPVGPPQQFLVGIAGLWFMVDEAHVTTIAVRGAYRRRGIGELLLISAIDLAVQKECRFVTLEVRASNASAQALYEKYGFLRAGLRRGYYTDNHEDALIMTTDEISSESYQSLFQGLKKAYTVKFSRVASPVMERRSGQRAKG